MRTFSDHRGVRKERLQRAVRPVIEALEQRTLLAAGQLDAPSAPILYALCDTGVSSSDGITSYNNSDGQSLQFEVTGAKPNANIQIILADTSTIVGTAPVDSDGFARVSLKKGLYADGVYSFVARQEQGEKTSPVSASTLVVIDTTAPGAPGIALDSASDSDNLTNVTTPIFDLSNLSASYRIYLDGTLVASGASVSTWTSPSLADGSHEFRIETEDLAGNISAQASTTINVDTAAPAAPAIDLADNAYDTGISNADRITSRTSVPILVTAPELSYQLWVDGVRVSGDSVDFTPYVVTGLADGTHIISACSVDAAGNRSAVAAEMTLTVDTQAPAAPTIALDPASDSGISDSDNITNVAMLTLNISGVASTYRLYGDGELVAAGDSNSVWHSWLLNNGSHTFRLETDDVAGNTSQSTLTITVDFHAIGNPAALTLLPGDDTGLFSTDGITSKTTYTFEVDTSRAPYYRIQKRQHDGTMSVISGLWETASTYTVTESSDGTYEYGAQAVDVAGNISGWYPVRVTVDRQAPAAPTSIDLADNSYDTGISDTDRITRSTNALVIVNAPEFYYQLWVDDTQLGNDIVGWKPYYLSGLADGMHVIRAYSMDAAGNRSAVAAEMTLTVDTQAPEMPSIALDPSSDTGTSNSDRVTNDNTPTFIITNTGIHYGVYRNNVLISGSETSPTFTVPSQADGLYNYAVHAFDVAGNQSLAGTVWVTIDTTPPATPTAPPVLLTDTGISSTDKITNSASPAFNSLVGGAINPQLYENGQPIQFPLADGQHSIAIRSQDAAGNYSADGPALLITVDTVKPAVPAIRLNASSDSGVSSSDNITNVRTPTFTISGADAQYRVYRNGVLQLTGAGSNGTYTSTTLADGTYTFSVASLDVAGNISDTSSVTITISTAAPAAPAAPDLDASTDSGLSNTDNVTKLSTQLFNVSASPYYRLYENGFQISADYATSSTFWRTLTTEGIRSYTVRAVDAAGNLSPESAALQVTYDKTPPGAQVPLLAQGSDTGIYTTDWVTKINTPTITTAGNSPYQLYVDSILVGTYAAGQNAVLSPLSNGSHTITMYAMDLAGNLATGFSQTITIDTIAPSATLSLRSTDDTGASSTDGVTSMTTPTFLLSSTNYFVLQRNGLDLFASYTWNSSYMVSYQSDGTYTFTARLSDLAGNTATTNAVPVTIDTIAPQAPAAPDLDGASDSGLSSTDNITNVTTPVFNISASPYFRFYRTGVLISGNYQTGSTYTTTTQTDGTYTYSVAAVDAAGNASIQSTGLSVTIDTVAPATPVAPDLQAASDSGVSSTDNITNVTTPTFAVSGGPYFSFYRNGVLISGTYQTGSTYTTAPQLDGVYDFALRALDAAGNRSAASAVTTVTIDTVAPVVPGTPDLQAASDSGISNTDNLTNSWGPTVDVAVAEPGTLTVVVDGNWAKAYGATATSAGTVSVTMVPETTPVQFLPAVTYTTSPSLKAGILDINLDGKLDIVQATYNDGLGILLGNGDGTFQPFAGYGANRAVCGFAIGDVNADGRLDAVTVNLYDHSIGVLLGAPTGFTEPRPAMRTGSNEPSDVALADVNGDGKLDAVAAYSNSTHLDVMLGNGDGSFQAATSLELGLNGQVQYLKTADLNGDGRPDLIAATTDSRKLVLLGLGAGAFAAPVGYVAGGSDFVVRDLNRDNKLDIATSRGTILLGTGNGSFVPGATVPGLSTGLSIGAGDVNGDGLCDLVFGRILPSATAVALGDGNGAFTIATSMSMAYQPYAVGVVDLNGDGFDDLVSATGNTAATAVVVNATGRAPALADGTHSITAVLTDRAGNQSAASASLSVTIDTVAPSAPAPVLQAASDSGVSSSDGITNVTNPVFDISALQGFGDVTTLLDGSPIAVDWSNPSLQLAGLADGSHTLTAERSDAAGNIATGTNSFTIDTVAPTATAPTLQAADDSGISSTDGITYWAVLHFDIVGPGYYLFLDGVEQNSAPVYSSLWTSPVLADGVHSVTVRVVDVAGNVSAQMATTLVTVDTVAPAAPSMPDLLPESDSGISDSDNLTNISSPRIHVDSADGTASVYLSGNSYAVGADGNVTLPYLSAGYNPITAYAMDAAGNASPYGPTLLVTYDPARPMAPSTPTLDSGDTNPTLHLAPAAPVATVWTLGWTPSPVDPTAWSRMLEEWDAETGQLLRFTPIDAPDWWSSNVGVAVGNGEVYVAFGSGPWGPGFNQLHVYDAATLQEVRVVDCGVSDSIGFGFVNGKLYSTNGGSITEIDPLTGAARATLPVTLGGQPVTLNRGLTGAPDRGTLLAYGGNQTVYEIDPATAVVLRTITLAGVTSYGYMDTYLSYRSGEIVATGFRPDDVTDYSLYTVRFDVVTGARLGYSTTPLWFDIDLGGDGYAPTRPVEYYRVYRDGVRISGDYVSGPSFTDESPLTGTHIYTVFAVDAAGNVSPASDPVVINPEAAVTIPDAALQAAIRQALNKPTGDITTTDMASLTSLSIWWSGVSSLSGLEYAVNLQQLQLSGNQVSDLTPLAGLSQLAHLDLSFNQVSDLTPLVGLSQLAHLDLNFNQVSDVTPLAGLEQLISLNLGWTQVADVTPLANLTNLTWLGLQADPVRDVSSLWALPQLLGLDLSVAGFADLGSLSGMTQLQSLFLEGNQITDVGGLANLTNLTTLFLSNNQISDISALAGMTKMFSLILHNNQISDLSPLSGMTELYQLTANDNRISDLSPLLVLSHLNSLELQNNQITSIAPLSPLIGLRWLDVSYNNLDISTGSEAMSILLAVQGRGGDVVYSPQNP